MTDEKNKDKKNQKEQDNTENQNTENQNTEDQNTENSNEPDSGKEEKIDTDREQDAFKEPAGYEDYYDADDVDYDPMTESHTSRSDRHPDEEPFDEEVDKEGKQVDDKQDDSKPPTSDDNDDDDYDDDDDDDDEDGEGKMPFLDHLEELRWTILRSLVAVLVGAIVCWFFSEQIITLLRRPGPKDMELIFLSPTEGFMTYIKVAIYAGIVVAFPYIAYQFWKFIVPGLLEKEKKFVPHIAFFTTLCFMVGATFAYMVIIPFGLRFLLGFETSFLQANITIGKYLGFVITIILVFGAVFELPVMSFFLTHIGIITPDFLRNNRRYGIVIIFIMAAVLTPPDIFTQLMLAGPLILLYEISIWVSRSVYKKKVKAEEAG